MTEMTTEQRNRASSNIDQLSALQIVQLMNEQDATVVRAVEQQKEHVARAAEAIAGSFRNGGRLFYIGAGTSGRLGVLDASECPPTFSTPPEMVVGVIAGGSAALTRAVEGAEDVVQQAAIDLQVHGFASHDILVGIATSGRTPYVLGGLEYARKLGATTVGFACNESSALHALSDIMIAPVVGPEIITGSTRLKAGTATKMVLNMLTTTAMVLIGKTYGNLMVDLRASNQKLKERSVRIVSEITGLNPAEAQKLLVQCAGEVKTAVIVHLAGVSPDVARQRLNASGSRLREALRGDVAAETLMPEDVDTEDVDAEDVDAEDVDTEDVDAEDVDE